MSLSNELFFHSLYSSICDDVSSFQQQGLFNLKDRDTVRKGIPFSLTENNPSRTTLVFVIPEDVQTHWLQIPYKPDEPIQNIGAMLALKHPPLEQYHSWAIYWLSYMKLIKGFRSIDLTSMKQLPPDFLWGTVSFSSTAYSDFFKGSWRQINDCFFISRCGESPFSPIEIIRAIQENLDPNRRGNSLLTALI